MQMTKKEKDPHKINVELLARMKKFAPKKINLGRWIESGAEALTVRRARELIGKKIEYVAETDVENQPVLQSGTIVRVSWEREYKDDARPRWLVFAESSKTLDDYGEPLKKPKPVIRIGWSKSFDESAECFAGDEGRRVWIHLAE